jgi:hypothetical protein
MRQPLGWCVICGSNQVTRLRYPSHTVFDFLLLLFSIFLVAAVIAIGQTLHAGL